MLYLLCRALDKLGDMFPKASPDQILKCLKQANGHMDTAVELLLMSCENSQVVMYICLHAILAIILG